MPDLGITSVSVLASFLLTGEIKIRASWELRSELEVAWQLLAVDRIRFKAALVGGGGGGGGGGSSTVGGGGALFALGIFRVA